MFESKRWTPVSREVIIQALDAAHAEGISLDAYVERALVYYAEETARKAEAQKRREADPDYKMAQWDMGNRE